MTPDLNFFDAIGIILMSNESKAIQRDRIAQLKRSSYGS